MRCHTRTHTRTPGLRLIDAEIACSGKWKAKLEWSSEAARAELPVCLTVWTSLMQ